MTEIEELLAEYGHPEGDVVNYYQALNCRETLAVAYAMMADEVVSEELAGRVRQSLLCMMAQKGGSAIGGPDGMLEACDIIMFG